MTAKTEPLIQTREILNMIDSPVIVFHENGAFEYINEEAIKLLGLNKKSLCNLSIDSITKDRKESEEILKSVFSDCKVSSKPKKFNINCFTGKYAKICIKSLKIVLDGTPFGLLFLKPVLKSNEMDSSFYFAGLSHDIRNILHTIEGSTNLLAELETSDEAGKLAKILQRSVAQLSAIVNDIVNFEEIKFKPPELKKESINTHNLISDLISIYSGVASAKGVKLSYEIGKEVPENIYTDKSMLTSILSNLLINALKFTDKGYVLAKCELSQDVENTGLLNISIKDTGKGKTKDKVKYIFMAYQKIPSELRSQYNGSGLGLALVHQYLNKLNATIDVSSQLGEGSCFKIKIPEKEIINKQSKTLIDNSDSKLEVLIIEDDIETASLIKDSMPPDKVSVDFCSNFDKSLKMIVKNKYNLIICDYHLGDRNGLMLKKQLNKRNIIIPFVLVTGNSDVEVIKKGFKVGILDYIRKPFKPEAIAKIVNHQILALSASDNNLTSLERQVPYCRILFVDDSVENHLLISKYLGKTLCEVDFASDGTVGVDKYMSGEYDLIYLDLHMPIMDGVSAAKKIRELELESAVSKSKIVIMTAGQFDSGKLNSVGADLLLSKPFDKMALLDSIAKLNPG